MNDEYYQKQLEIQRDLNKNIVERFKEIGLIMTENNKEFQEIKEDLYNKIEKQEIEINYLKSKLEEILISSSNNQNQLFSYNPINYIASHLFYGFLLYEGFYLASKFIIFISYI